jgi:hypothetical protein
LFHDPEYAKKVWNEDIPAYFVFDAHDDSYMSPFPEGSRDTVLVSQASHHVERFADIYPEGGASPAAGLFIRSGSPLKNTADHRKQKL